MDHFLKFNVVTFYLMLCVGISGVLASDAELKTVMEGIKFNESLLKSGEGTFRLKVFMHEDFGKGSPGWEWPYKETEGRITWELVWKFKDKKGYFKKDPTASVYKNRQRYMVFNGEKYAEFFDKEALVSSDPRTMDRAGEPPYFYRLRAAEPLSATFKNASSVKLIGTEELGNSLCYLLDVKLKEGDTRKYRVWIDPSKGFNARKIEVESYLKAEGKFPALTIRTIKFVQRFKEYPGGIFFPEEATFEWYRVFPDGKQLLVLKASLHTQSFEPNSNPADGFFEIKFPPGTLVYDRILEVKYKVPEIGESPSLGE